MPSVRTPILAAVALAWTLGASAHAQQTPAAPPPGHDHAAPAAPPSAGGRTPAPVGSYAYIGWPNDRTVIRSTRFRIWFGLRGMGVAPAETDTPNTGHHHVLIDSPLPPLDEPIPNDKKHLHFGKGQTEAVIELPPGTHTLQLLLGDAHHIPFDPPVMSKKITVTVRP
jgi:hypothetical protein